MVIPMDQYSATLGNLGDKLKEYGFAILPCLLDPDEIAEFQCSMWDYLEHLTQLWNRPINRTDKLSWKLINKLNFGEIIFGFWNSGHCQMAWNIRQNPKVINVFAHLFNCHIEDMLCSFDAASIILPPEVKGGFWREESSSLWHTDQSHLNNNLVGYQSWVTAFDVNEGDATLAVLKSSHRYRNEFLDAFPDTNLTRKFYALNSDELEFYKSSQGCTEILVTCPAGSMVIWDSRTIHYGIEPSIERIYRNIRCVSYVSYCNRAECGGGGGGGGVYNEDGNDDYNAIMKTRQDGFANLETSNHDPIKMTFKPTQPHENAFEDLDITPITEPQLTLLGKCLIGHRIAR